MTYNLQGADEENITAYLFENLKEETTLGTEM